MKKILLLLAVVALATSPAMAQEDFNIMGSGARAHGMGGAFIGVADDATAVGWNPAGIAQLDKMEASLVGLFASKKYSEEWTIGITSDKWDESVSHIAPMFASFIFPFKVSQKNLVMGVAFQRLIDFGYADKDTGTFLGVTYESTDKVTGGVDAITPAVAFQIVPQFSIGAAGNILVRGAKEKYEEEYTNGWNWTQEWDLKYSGFDLNAGVLATLKKFNIGASLRLPFTLTEEISYHRETTISGISPATMDTTFPENEYTFPLMLGFGLAVKPTDKLTIAADFEHRHYSSTEETWKTEVYDIPYDTSSNVIGYKDTTANIGWQDCNQFRVGLEYIFTGQNVVFPVRLGFRTDPKTYRGMKGDPTNPDTSQVTGLVFTGGFGLKMGSVMLDLAAEYGMAKIFDIEGSNYSDKFDEKSLNVMTSFIFHF